MRIVRAVCVAVIAVSLGSVEKLNAATSVQFGWVRSNGAPIAFASVRLYLAGDQKGSGEVELGSTQASSDGYFIIPFDQALNDQSVLYVIASANQPAPATRLAAVIGSQPNATGVVVNERTTVATAVAMAQFIDGISIGGKWPGLQNAAGTLRNLVNISNGNVAPMLASPPNGTLTSTMAAFNSLANMLAGCVSGQGDCALLFASATPPGGEVPYDTLQAAINIAHVPWQNREELFAVSQVYAPYQPALTAAPKHWALAIKYVGNGREFDGPGAMAIDERGDVWITNNYIYKKNHATPTCAGETLLKLTALGTDAPGAPYNGKKAGLSGAGFGITLDPQGNVWVSNFGFYGSTCPEHLQPLANSLSKFDPAGNPLSPRDGIMQGCINAPQGTASDRVGNIWIANTCNGTITRYRNGDPNDHWVYDIAAGQLSPAGVCPSDGANRVFDIAIDADGNAWISNNTAQSAFKLSAKGQLLATSSPAAAIHKPLGIAIDSRGHVWVSSSGILTVPCAANNEELDYGSLLPDLDHAGITELDADGNLVGNYRGGGIEIPWGIAVDGNDNIWSAQFGGQRVCLFDGRTGQPIAPEGFFSDGLVRLTGVSIDPSGNVWLANNWLLDPVQTNPGGDAAVVFIGLAAPVKTPLFGPPQKP